MWSVEAWDEINLFFPDNGNRSRVVITTRISNFAIDVSASAFVMNFLDENKSWKLFCERAFGEEGCPLELEEIGKKIAKKCKGLPLSIVVIGGHLGKSFRTKEHWENVANDINSILSSGDDERCSSILSLSYSHLPVHLKPCFLYMGIFAEDDEIRVSQLIKLWVAEGFLRPNKSQSLEEVAEDYLNDLVDRNLILVCTRSRNGKIKTCSIHDLLRELCLKVAKKEKFLCILDTPQAVHRERRVVIHKKIREEKHHPAIFHALKSAPLVRSLKCKGGQLSIDFRLLKVLNKVEGAVNEFDGDSVEANFQQVNLRYLRCEFYKLVSAWMLGARKALPSLYLPSSISRPWNLQTLIIEGSIQIIAPSEIWEMPQLRNLEVDTLCLPDPPPSDQQNDIVLPNLLTLSAVQNFRWSEEVCRRIPNVQKLHIWYRHSPGEFEVSSYYCQHNLGRFHKLTSLQCIFDFNWEFWRDFLPNLTFPSSLQKLSLGRCALRLEDLKMIGSLPHLEVLKLGSVLVEGPTWDPVEGGFLRLKFLKIRDCNGLIYWNADSSHFPVLEKIYFGRLRDLNEIPSGIGEIPTLRSIRLECCSVSAAVSAMKILAGQESLGNDGLQLEVEFLYEEELESFKEMVQAEGLTSNNLVQKAPHTRRGGLEHVRRRALSMPSSFSFDPFKRRNGKTSFSL